MNVYFDNAATTPLDPEVINEMENCMRNLYGNPSSIHAMGRKSRAVIESARKSIASHLNCSIGEIFFTSGGTEANNMAIKCSVRDLDVKRIITTKMEHHCVLHTIETLKESHDIAVEYVPVNAKGEVNYDVLAELLGGSSVKTLVSIMHANNEVGTMIDIDKVGLLCEEFDAFFHSDTVQTVGHYQFDLQKLKIDFMSGGAHKFHGPKGVGFIMIRNSVTVNPLIDGGSQERNMRAGTENLYGIAGMAKALDIAYNNFESKKNKVSGIRNYLKAKIFDQFPDVQIAGSDNSHSLYTILNVGFPKTPKSDMLLFNLDIRGICASAGSACSSGATAKSHVLEAMNLGDERSYVRFSFSHFNNKKEVDYLIQNLAESL